MECQNYIGFYRAVLGVVILSVRLSVRPSVCPSVTRVLCD